jgi:hypothetical protein
MGCFIFIDYLIGLIILIRIHASWWAWLIYIVSVLVWIVIGVSRESESNEKTTSKPKHLSEGKSLSESFERKNCPFFVS